MTTLSQKLMRCLLPGLVILMPPKQIVAQGAATAASAENASISSRIKSLNELSPELKAKLAVDLQNESTEHFGFEAIKSVDDLSQIDISKLPPTQRKLIDSTTMHVVDSNLVPIAVLKHSIKPTGKQIYPDLQALVDATSDDDTLAVSSKVGRIRYWVRNGLPASSMQENEAYLAGTGFVVGPGMVATACHVLNYIADNNLIGISPTIWAKIDFSADGQTHKAFEITGILGKGTLQGQDYAILAVSSLGEDGAGSLPDPMIMGLDTNTKYVGVIGYPDVSGAKKACSPGGTGCDETNKWFADFSKTNPDVIKVISPGRKTGDFSPHGFPILTYDSPTLGGQSGSPVIDLLTHQVIGLHYCCTGYAPKNDVPSCAALTPISLGDKSQNEALSIKNVVIPAR